MSPQPNNVVPLDTPLLSCRNHRSARAGWRCTACEAPLCPDCVVGRRAQTVELVSCRQCGDVAEPLLTHRRRVPLAQRMKSAWRYVFSTSGLQVLVAVSIPLMVLGWLTEMTIIFLKPITLLMYWSVFWATFYKLARESARGEMELSTPDYSNYIQDGIVPGLMGMVTFALVWLPALVYATLVRPLLLEASEGKPFYSALLGPFSEFPVTDPVLWGLVLLALAWLPVVLLLTAAGSPVSTLVNVRAAMRLVRKLGRDYAVLVGGLAVLGVVHLLAHGLADALLWMDVLLVSRLLAEAVTLVVPFTTAHVLGLVLYTRGDALGYGLDREYLEPVLGATPPKHQASPLREDALFPNAGEAAPFVEVETPTQKAANDALAALAAAVDARDVPLAMSLYATLRQQPHVRVPPAHHLFVGQAAATEGNFPLAVQALESAADVAPEDPIAPRALVLLARVLGERMQDIPRAEEVYRYVLHRYPDTAAARFARERVAPTSD
ncbi:hypothetical protein [Myxococcus sp. Y35]|uniref:hypothetical protein n=1 Tax=Pseudomyxococcus flavus TaxID=3115648 RepID=UPI003CF6D40C